MYVALGFCTAGLIGLAILPAFYRRAARLTEEALRAVNPASYTEVRAAQDQERARYAVELRRVETRLDNEREKAAKYHLEASRLRSETETLKKEHQEQLTALETRLAEQSSDQQAVDMLSAEIKTLKGKLSDSEKALAQSWAKAPDAATTGKPAPGAPQEDDERDWLPATDTMALATITGLEAEVATLKAKLARYEPTVASEVEASLKDASRSRLAELEAQLVDTESKYVDAQAEATRLSLLLDAANATDRQPDKHLKERLKQLSGEIARQQSDLQEKDRVQKRLVGQLRKLRGDLESVPALKELRADFRALARRISDAGDITVSPAADLAAGPKGQSDSSEVTSAGKTGAAETAMNGTHPSAGGKPDRQPDGADLPVQSEAAQKQAKSADIATAAEALVSRIVASSRNKAKTPAEGEQAAAAANSAPAKSETGTARKSKSAKQKKRDVA